MKNIVFFDDRSQTETTLVLNENGEVIGIETYFATPRELSSFFNKNEIFRQQPVPRISKPNSHAQNKRVDLPPQFNALDSNLQFAPDHLAPNHPNVRFEISKNTPCGGPRQRPCK